MRFGDQTILVSKWKLKQILHFLVKSCGINRAAAILIVKFKHWIVLIKL